MGMHDQADEGLTLIEVLASIVLVSAVVLAVDALWTTVSAYYTRTLQVSQPLGDSEMVYWRLEELSQNAYAVGTQTEGNAPSFESVTSSTSVSVLSLRVSSLEHIAPAGCAAAAAVSGGDWVNLAVMPVNGTPMLVLFPGGVPYDPSASPPSPPPEDVFPLGSGNVSYAGTSFTVLAPLTKSGAMSTSPGFDVSLEQAAVSTNAGASMTVTPTMHTYRYFMGSLDY